MKTEAQLSMMVYNFNKTFSVGDRIKVKMDNGEIKQCTIKSPATLLSGHTPVIWLNEISGCYLLERAIY